VGSDTPTWAIGGKAAQTFYYAEQQAERIGWPLTHCVTINFALTAVDPRAAVASFSDLRRNRFNKWATRPLKHAGPAFPPTYAFAFENVRDKTPFLTMEPGDPHNVHVHWTLHLPPSRVHDFENAIWGWVEATTGGIIGGGEAIKVTSFRPTRYLLKGTHPFIARRYARGQETEPQGIIIGRRADTSRNLGPTARRAHDRELGIRRRLPSRTSQAPYAPPP
jgi:hypothetical protein